MPGTMLGHGSGYSVVWQSYKTENFHWQDKCVAFKNSTFNGIKLSIAKFILNDPSIILLFSVTALLSWFVLILYKILPLINYKKPCELRNGNKLV